MGGSISGTRFKGAQGVALVLNVTDPAAAHEMLEKLPLGQAHLMSFELIPIAPLNPLRQLQGIRGVYRMSPGLSTLIRNWG
jgi:hypothetical protein